MFDFDKIFAKCVRDIDDLKDYQDYAVDWLYENSYSALFAGTGLGKTIIILTLLDRLFSEGYSGKVLVDAPIKVANTVWQPEIARWRHTAWMSSTLIRVEDDDPRLMVDKARLMDELKPRLAHMTDRQEAAKVKQSLIKQHLTELKQRIRRKLLKSRSLIHIINHEATDWLVDYYVTRRKPWPYRILIWDESSKLRDHNSNVFNAIKEMRPYMERVHELTATPAKQSYRYFFSQIYLLDRGDRFGRGITAFNDRYFTQNRWSRKFTLRPGADTEIENLISDIVLTMKKEDYSDLQKPTINIRPVFLSDDIRDKYREFEKTAILETPDEQIIEAKSAGILNNKLLQLATGSVYDAKRDVHFFHETKFDELQQLLDETLDEPVLCSYWFKPTLARLRKRFPKAGVMDRQGKMVEPWNKRKFKLMFIHPASAAHGIELQFGGHHLAVLDLFHSAELFEQLVGRLDRQGQTDPVTVHILAARGTIDTTVSRRLQILEDAQSAMYKRLQRLHKKLRRRD
jgi:SNF2 family DNA or RNA helicase